MPPSHTSTIMSPRKKIPAQMSTTPTAEIQSMACPSTTRQRMQVTAPEEFWMGDEMDSCR